MVKVPHKYYNIRCLQKILVNKKKKGFNLSLNYNRANSNLFVSGTEIIKFKAKDSKIKPYHLCLGGIEINFSVDNKKKNGLERYI